MAEIQERTLLDRIPAVATATTALVAAFSIIYDLSYFLMIDIRLFSLLTIQDHITSFLSSVPAFLFTLLGAYGNATITRVRHPKDTEDNPNYVAIGTTPENTIYLLRYNWYAFFIILVLYVFMLVANTYLSAMYVIVASFVIIHQILYFLFRYVYRTLSVRVRSILYYGLFLLTSAICIGLANGSQDLQKEGPFKVILKENAELNGVTLLRSGSIAVLTRIPAEQKIMVIPWDTISRIERGRYQSPKSFICRWTGYMCREFD
jgi:hypothetical protein